MNNTLERFPKEEKLFT